MPAQVQKDSKGQKCSYEEIKKGNITLHSANTEIINWTKKAPPIWTEIKSEREKHIGVVGFKRRENQINVSVKCSFCNFRIFSLHTKVTTHSQNTQRPPNLPEQHPSPDTPKPGRVGFHGGGVLHHFEHGHHQENDVDLSKQTRIRVNRLHSERH